jgi:hypothetical protein
MRVATFTLTLLPADLDDPQLAPTLALVDAEVRRAEFHPTLGETPTRRSWWRFW